MRVIATYFVDVRALRAENEKCEDERWPLFLTLREILDYNNLAVGECVFDIEDPQAGLEGRTLMGCSTSQTLAFEHETPRCKVLRTSSYNASIWHLPEPARRGHTGTGNRNDARESHGTLSNNQRATPKKRMINAWREGNSCGVSEQTVHQSLRSKLRGFKLQVRPPEATSRYLSRPEVK
ncbi:hypothetical protein EI94DRAFT_318255 [Lactarius quietus]|nr:hypothetical protein EI94DRAFT_318255 [Lactarius quietus]